MNESNDNPSWYSSSLASSLIQSSVGCRCLWWAFFGLMMMMMMMIRVKEKRMTDYMFPTVGLRLIRKPGYTKNSYQVLYKCR